MNISYIHTLLQKNISRSMFAVDGRRVVVDGIKPDEVCMRSPEIQNCKFFNSRDAMAMATTAAGRQR